MERNDVHPAEAVKLIRDCKDIIPVIPWNILLAWKTWQMKKTDHDRRFGLPWTKGAPLGDRIEMGSVNVPGSCVDGLKACLIERRKAFEYL